MKANNLVQCSTSQTQALVCVGSYGVLITLCLPYYRQLSLWAPCLDDSVLTIVLQPIIFQIPELELQLTKRVCFGKLKLLADFIPDFPSVRPNFLFASLPCPPLPQSLPLLPTTFHVKFIKPLMRLLFYTPKISPCVVSKDTGVLLNNKRCCHLISKGIKGFLAVSQHQRPWCYWSVTPHSQISF